MSKQKMTRSTIAVHAGMNPAENHGIPNPPVYHASTILKPCMADYRTHKGKYDYGRLGTPTSDALEGAVAALYGAEAVVAVPSGLSAIATGILAMVKHGDSVLLPDSMYGAGRRFVETIFPDMGVEAVFYDPCIDAAGLSGLLGNNTALLYIESPGSMTFEMQDVAALMVVAKAHKIPTACDNTWGTPFYFDAVAHGFDVIIEAGTKYISGHSDVSIGFVAGVGDAARRLRRYTLAMGLCVGPDDMYLALRGMRSMAVRLERSAANGLVLAKWLEAQPEVIAMRHPALASHPGHALWQRDFTGASGLFGFMLDAAIPVEAVDAFADNLALFGIGASWGGHESLISEAHEKSLKRSVTQAPEGRVMRIYAGLEDADDLLADLEAGFERMRDAMGKGDNCACNPAQITG